MRKLLVMVLTAVFIMTLWSVPVFAQDPVQKELKLNEAITMALEKSESYQKAKLEVDKAEVQRDNASDQLGYTPNTDGGGSPNPAVDSAWYSLLTADMGWEASKKSKTAEEDKLVLDTCKKYWAVQKAQADLKSKELALTKAESALRRIQAMVRLGMSPPESSTAGPELATATAERTLATAKMDLTTAQNGLKTAYEAFNKVVGLLPEERPDLVDEVNYEPLKVDSLEAEVQRALDDSPSVWKAQEDVNLAEYANDLGFSTGQYKDSDIRAIEKDQANLEAVSAKDAVELLTRSFYYQVKTLEDAIPASEKGLKEAEEGFRVAKLYYDLGMSTREDLQKSEASLADAKKKLLEAKTNHAYYVMAFQKPWAASSGSGS